MKKILLVLILTSINLLAQTSKKHQLLLPFRDGNLWGFCDTLGSVKVKPAFNKIENFAINKNFYGKYVVRSKNKISVIDQYRKVLLAETDGYDSIIVTESDRETAVFKNGKMGVLKNFKPFIPAEYDRINLKGNGSYTVKIGELQGLINSEGKLIIPVEYKYISQSYDKEDKNNTQYVWEAEGVFVTKKFYDKIYTQDSDEVGPPSMIGVQEGRPRSEKIKEMQKRLLDQYDDVQFYESQNFIIVTKNGKKGILSYPDEKIIFNLEYDDIEHLGDEKEKKVFRLQKNKKSGILREDKKVILPMDYDEISYEYDFGRYYVLKKDGKEGVFLMNTVYKPISAKYKTIRKVKSLSINDSWEFGLFEVETTDGKKGIVGENGKEYFKN